MARPRQSSLLLIFAVCAAAAYLCFCGSTAFVPPPRADDTAAKAAAVAAAGLAPLAVQQPAIAFDGVQELTSSSLSLGFQPWEDPNIGFVFLLSGGTLSIALVVWGRNGF